MKHGEKKKSSTGGEIEKTKTGVKHTAKDRSDDEDTKPATGEKRGRGRPKKYTDDKPRQERVTAKSRKKDRTAWTKKKTDEAYLPIRVSQAIKEGKLNVYKILSGTVEAEYRVPEYLEAVYEDIAMRTRLDKDVDFDKIMSMMEARIHALAAHTSRLLKESFDQEQDDVEVHDQGEYDQEGDMAKDQLHSIEKAADELAALLDDEDNLPEWVQSKITKALDYLQATNQYMDQERHDSDMMQVNELSPDTLSSYADKAKGQRNWAGGRAMAAAQGNRRADPEGKFDRLADKRAAGYNKAVSKGARDLDKSGQKTSWDYDTNPTPAALKRDKGMPEDAVEESGLQAYLGKKKYGKDGMAALQQAGREGASKEKMAKIRAKHDQMDEASALSEKAVSQQQQKFMGMAHAMQKGQKIKGASPELKKVARSMKKGDVEDFAKTKHAGLPKRVKSGKPVGEELHGGQKKIDMNKNGKLDAQDFKMLRHGKKKTSETTVAGSMAPAAAPMGKTRRRTQEEMTDVLRAEKGGVRGATMPPPDSEFPPGDPRNMRKPKPAAPKPAAPKPVKKAEAPGGEQAVAETDKNPTDKPAKSSGGFQFGKGIYDSVNRKLEDMISESLSIDTSINDEGGKNINISASDEDAEKLAQMLKLAGLGNEAEGDVCPACGGQHDSMCGDEPDMMEEVTDNDPDYPVNMGQKDDPVFILQTLAGGLNKPKRDQTTLPHTAVRVTEKDHTMENIESSLWKLYNKVN